MTKQKYYKKEKKQGCRTVNSVVYLINKGCEHVQFIEGLPRHEKLIYKEITLLSKQEKAVLKQLIIDASKDHITLVPHMTPIIQSLLKRKLIYRNHFYVGKNYSIRVLPEALHLMSRLKYSLGENK
ncbi:hypothetical protein [Radiobacillus sp. PE A8.2]|uniref:hypothetical protein n=1 Tax=Radiobacillus sp. PE A8.2 TaxID=3380349 RepID=UPI00388EAE1B